MIVYSCSMIFIGFEMSFMEIQSYPGVPRSHKKLRLGIIKLFHEFVMICYSCFMIFIWFTMSFMEIFAYLGRMGVVLDALFAAAVYISIRKLLHGDEPDKLASVFD